MDGGNNMDKQQDNYSIAVKDHLLDGGRLTRLEALVLFGTANLPALITNIRRSGFTVKTRQVSYALALRRINQLAHLTPPKDLPVREIFFTEYRVEK